MLLGEFINKFIRPESLVRLLYEVPGKTSPTGGAVYQEVMAQPVFEWGIGASPYYRYAEVVGITDIPYPPDSLFPEAVNIIIKRPE